MKVKTIYLVQEDETALKNLAKEIARDGFEIIGTSCDGTEGASQIVRLKPDVVITSLTISGIDGLELVERVKTLIPQTKIIVYSTVRSEEIVHTALSRGADFYLIKPTSGKYICDRICDLLSGNQQTYSTKNTPDEKISKIFLSIGIPPHIKGYVYLRESIKMVIDKPSLVNHITRELYPQIGEKYQTTPSKVERAMRHAIEVAFNKGRVDAMNNVVGVKAYSLGDKPTNGEFIALIADKLLLEGV